MWGICFYSKVILENRLFQKVVAFDLDADKKTAVLSQPEDAGGLKIPVMELKLLSEPPEFAYGETVRIVRHPEHIGKITDIFWNFKYHCCYYYISVDGIQYHTRFFAKELMKCQS